MYLNISAGLNEWLNGQAAAAHISKSQAAELILSRAWAEGWEVRKGIQPSVIVPGRPSSPAAGPGTTSQEETSE